MMGQSLWNRNTANFEPKFACKIAILRLNPFYQAILPLVIYYFVSKSFTFKLLIIVFVKKFQV